MAVTTNWNIYYPTDYTADADIPKDMKDMADSIEAAMDNILGSSLKSSDIETTITSSSTNSKVAGAKAVYDYVQGIVGGINAVLDEINRNSNLGGVIWEQQNKN